MKIKKRIDDYDDSEAHEKMRAPADWGGPLENRKCTDLLWLLLIILCWVGMTGVGIFAIGQGDYRLVIHPLDYDGNVCGVDFDGRDMTDYPYLYYVNTLTGVCVKECPSLEGMTNDSLTDVHTLITYTGVWQSSHNMAELPETFLEVADYSYTLQEASNDTSFNIDILGTNNFQCNDELCFPSTNVGESWETNGINRGFGFAYYLTDTYELLQRCFMSFDARDRLANLTGMGDELTDPALSSDLDDASTVLSNFFGDIWIARFYILGFGFGFSLLVSLVYMFLLRIPCLLSSLVWLSIFTVITLFAGSGYYASELAKEWEAANPPVVRDDQIQATTIASYVLYGIAAVMLIVAVCMCSQIQLAVTCVKQAGRAINQQVLIFFIPVIQVVCLVLFTMIWAFYGTNLASLGEITVEELEIPLTPYTIPIRTYEFNDDMAQLGWFLLFCFYWTASFILAVGQMAISVTISKWYFTVEKRDVSMFAPLGALGTTIKYHAGTCAFGSLIIAIIKLMRTMLNSIQKQIEEMTNEKLANLLLCCCQCCLCCLEKCVQFINQNAYIQCAIFGTPFCESGRKAFFLILRNAKRIGAVSYVSGAVLFVGKIFISTLTSFSAYYAIVEYFQLELYSFAGPVVTIFIISYFVADMFMDVFDMSILCILHCFVADEEMFDGRARYADGSLTSWVDKHGGMEE